MENQATYFTTFIGGDKGIWKTKNLQTIKGASLASAPFLDIVQYQADTVASYWQLKGVKSNLRYTTRPEKRVLDQNPSVLGTPENNLAAFIPIRKSDEWWTLTQDERRKIIEEDSKHIQIGIKYLAQINRQLYHCRDLGEEFDFLTWFEFAPANAGAFDELVDRLRQTEEWKYVTKEVDIRLERV